MSDLTQTIGFVAGIYQGRARAQYLARVRREPMAMLETRAGREDPYPVYERMRSKGTIYETVRGNWATANHRVASEVLRDRRLGVVKDPMLDASFLDRNPPDHTRLRRLAQPAFSPKTLPGFRDRIEKAVGDLLDRAAAAGRFDLVPALAAPLPIGVITDLLGIPDADTAEFAEYGAAVASALDGIKSLSQAKRVSVANARLHALFERVVELRRREPADDVISRLIAAEGDQLRPGELEPMVFLLLIAGFETTVNLIGNCVLALLSRRDQWELLCSDPERYASKAVEETLRFDPPVQGTSRVALEDVEIEGHLVRKGRLILPMIAGAGRDPEVYDRPAVFDIEREPGVDHLAFSGGIHYCLGQPLARLEADIAIRMLAERLPGLRSAGTVRRRPMSVIRGPLELPVSVV